MSNTAPDYVRPNGFIGLKAGRTELFAETRLLRFVRMSQVKSTFSATCRAYGGAERLRAGLSVAERKAAAGSQIAAAELNPRGWSQLDSATGQFYRRVEKLILFPLFVDSSAVAGIRSSNREACGALASSIVPEMRLPDSQTNREGGRSCPSGAGCGQRREISGRRLLNSLYPQIATSVGGLHQKRAEQGALHRYRVASSPVDPSAVILAPYLTVIQGDQQLAVGHLVNLCNGCLNGVGRLLDNALLLLAEVLLGSLGERAAERIVTGQPLGIGLNAGAAFQLVGKAVSAGTGREQRK